MRPQIWAGPNPGPALSFPMLPRDHDKHHQLIGTPAHHEDL